MPFAEDFHTSTISLHTVGDRDIDNTLTHVSGVLFVEAIADSKNSEILVSYVTPCVKC